MAMHETIHKPRRFAGDTASLIIGIVGGISLGFAFPSLKDQFTSESISGVITALSILTAMIGTYLALVVVVMAARIPWVEKEIGQDRLIAWHRKAGPYAVGLIIVHVLLVTVGYAIDAQVNVVAQFVDFVLNYPWMMAALAGFILFFVMGFGSWWRFRVKMKYETWHVGHMYFYLAIALAFLHQVVDGSVFPNHLLATVWWTGLTVLVFAAVIVFRFAVPLYRSWKYNLRVADVRDEGDDCVSVYLTGRHLDQMPVKGGQWFSFRFMTREWWWQGHPYSISNTPNGKYLRVTVKNLGDQSGSLMSLRKGTRVWIEGPYGVFTDKARVMNHAVLLAGGIGVTPILSLLGSIPASVPVTVIYRVHGHGRGAPLHRELETVCARRPNSRLVFLPGTRQEYPLTLENLRTWAPDIARSDFYICGAAGFVEAAVEDAHAAGIPADRVHHELFSF